MTAVPDDVVMVFATNAETMIATKTLKDGFDAQADRQGARCAIDGKFVFEH